MSRASSARPQSMAKPGLPGTARRSPASPVGATGDGRTDDRAAWLVEAVTDETIIGVVAAVVALVLAGCSNSRGSAPLPAPSTVASTRPVAHRPASAAALAARLRAAGLPVRR